MCCVSIYPSPSVDNGKLSILPVQSKRFDMTNVAGKISTVYSRYTQE